MCFNFISSGYILHFIICQEMWCLSNHRSFSKVSVSSHRDDGLRGGGWTFPTVQTYSLVALRGLYWQVPPVEVNNQIMMQSYNLQSISQFLWYTWFAKLLYSNANSLLKGIIWGFLKWRFYDVFIHSQYIPTVDGKKHAHSLEKQ